MYGLDLVALREPLQTMQAATLSRFTQVAKDTPSAINTLTGSVGMPNELQQPSIVLGPLGQRALQPGIEARASHL